MTDQAARVLSVLVNGRQLNVAEGQSVAAALLTCGVITLRTTRQGRPRGMFCAMGVCFDCLVEIDGRQRVRACLETARDGMEIRLGEEGS